MGDENRERLARAREERIRTFAEGHRFDPSTHHLIATAVYEAPDGGRTPREAVSIVPLGKEFSLAITSDEIRRLHPTFILPREIDIFAINGGPS